MYEAKLTGLKPKDVMFLISALPAHVDCKFAQAKTVEKANGKAPVGRVNPNTCIMLGKNHAEVQHNSLSDRIVRVLTKHEKKHGAGSMTRSELTDAMSEWSDAPAAAIGAALKRDVIRGVES